MLAGIVIQTADLKWLVPMAVGAVALLGCVIALFVNRSWSLVAIAALAAALIGASVFTKVSVSREGLIVETAQLSAQVLTDLQAVGKANSDAIGQLTSRINELAAATQKVASGQPAGSTQTLELNKISEETKKIQGTINMNDDLLKNVGKNNELIKQQMRVLDPTRWRF
jgi:hypothetical protein